MNHEALVGLVAMLCGVAFVAFMFFLFWRESRVEYRYEQGYRNLRDKIDAQEDDR